MKTDSDIGQLSVAQLIEALGSRQISPGSGAAGAVSLALGAACALKAVCITLKHHPEAEDLARLQRALEGIAQYALEGADRDAQTFTAFIKEHSVEAVDQLIREGDQVARLITLLSALTDQIAPRIDASMAGDIVAARALTQAARSIQASNSAEARGEKSQLSSPVDPSE